MPIKAIVTDIEGTTSSVRFVYEVLFPYFRNNIQQILNLKQNIEVQQALEETIVLAFELDGKVIESEEEIVAQLLEWSLEDKKITPLKTLQGFVWDHAYRSGEIKGHVYADVPTAFENWKKQKLNIHIFSSGSIAAQKLIFGFSEFGDLTPFISEYFDTTTGGKRDLETYVKIAEKLKLNPSEILFLSDIKEELEAADEADFQTIQLLREDTKANWKNTVGNFQEIQF